MMSLFTKVIFLALIACAISYSPARASDIEEDAETILRSLKKAHVVVGKRVKAHPMVNAPQTRIIQRKKPWVFQTHIELVSLNSLRSSDLFSVESPEPQEFRHKDVVIQAMGLSTGNQQHFRTHWAAHLKELHYTTLRELHVSGLLMGQLASDAPYWKAHQHFKGTALQMSKMGLVFPPLCPPNILSQITVLNLEDNALITTQGIDRLSNLVTLNLMNNRLKQVDGLEALTNLDFLALNDNQLPHVDGLEGLTKLRALALMNNRLTNLDSVQYLPMLELLVLSVNPLSHINGLERLSNLQTLGLSQDQMDKPEIAAAVNALPITVKRHILAIKN